MTEKIFKKLCASLILVISIYLCLYMQLSDEVPPLDFVVTFEMSMKMTF